MLFVNILVLAAFAFLPVRMLIADLRDPEGKPGKSQVLGVVLLLLLSTAYAGTLMYYYYFY